VGRSGRFASIAAVEFEICAVNADDLVSRVPRKLLRNESVAHTQRE
jgi:hypothetical protein